MKTILIVALAISGLALTSCTSTAPKKTACPDCAAGKCMLHRGH